MDITPFDILGYPEDEIDFEILDEGFDSTPLNLLDLFFEVEKNIDYPSDLF